MSGFDLKEGLRVGKNGLIFGAAIGGAAGAYTGHKQAGRSHIDPWNGKSTIKQQTNYNLSTDPNGDNVKLYRGTTGSETDGGPLFMTDDPNYAATYVKNGGQVIEATVPRSMLNQMCSDGVLNYAKGVHQTGGYHTEYIFNNSVKSTIMNQTKTYVP